MKVLFVDDEPGLLEQAKIFLEREEKDLEIKTVESSDEALKKLDSDSFDAIVSDYQMPGMDGLQFLKKIREDKRDDIPFIMFTGKGREKVAMEALNLGANRYIQKGGDPRSQYGTLRHAIKQEIEHYSAKRRVKKSEQKYRRLMETSQEAIIVHDLEGKIEFANMGKLSKLGYSKKDLEGMNVSDLVSPEYRDILENNRQERLQGEEKTRLYELEALSKEGERVPVEISATPLLKGDEIEKIQLTARDMSERKRREQRIKDLNSLLKSIRDVNQLIIQEDNLKDLLQKSCDTIINTRNYNDISIVLFTPDKNNIGYRAHSGDMDIDLDFEGLPECLENVIQSKEIDIIYSRDYCEDCEFCKIKEDHQPLLVPMMYNDEIYGVLVACLDPERKVDEDEKNLLSEVAEDLAFAKRKLEIENELKESRRRYRRLFNKVKTGIIVHEPDGKIVSVNPKAEEILGISEKELKKMVTNDWKGMFYDENGNEMDIHDFPVRRVIKTKEAVEEMVIGLKGKDREEINWYILDAEPIFDKNNELKRIIVSFMDISKQKDIERRLHESKRKLSTLVKNLPGMAYRCKNNKNWTMKFISEGCKNLTGYKKEQLIEDDEIAFSDLIHPDDKDYVWKEIQKSLKEDEPFKIEYRIRTSDNEEKWVWEHGRGFKNDKDQIILEGIILDITSRKASQQELKNYKMAVEHSYDLISAADREYNYLFANQSYLDYNKVEEDIIGKNARDVIGKEAFDEKVKPKLDKCLQGETVRYSMKREHKELGERYLDIYYYPLRDERDEIVGVVSSMRDITELKEIQKELTRSEKKYRALYNSIRDAILVADTDRNIIDCNPAFNELFGYSLDEIKGEKTHYVYQNRDEFEEMGEKIREHIGEQNFFFTVNYEKKSGEVFPGETNVFYLKDERGEITGFIGLIRDVSERKKAKEREEFLHSLLRHDVRNKAQVIKGYLQLIEEEFDLPDEASEYFQKAEKGVYESLDLIEKVRTLRKVEEEEITKVNVTKAIHEAVEERKSFAKDIDIEIIMNCPSDECQVIGGSLLKEVFSNILENSIQHSEGSKIRITEKKENSIFRCIIEDDGIGIKDEIKEKVFQKGYTTDEERGTGLGLFLVKMLLESYNGSVKVKDSDMGGAKFEIILKRA